MITLGTGVGGGIIIDGGLYAGSFDGAGEIGHTIVVKGGLTCACGDKGCLERYIGAGPLVEMAREEIKKGRKTLINNLVNGDTSAITPKVLYNAAVKKDPLALEVWSSAGEYLGTALTNAINLLNPARIVVGGGISQAFRFIAPSMWKTIRRGGVTRILAKNLKITASKLGDDAGLLGSAMLVWHKK